MLLTVNKKTGFVCYDRELRIYESNGKPFYFNDKPVKHEFNLPKGVYKTSNYLIQKKKPFEFEKVKLAKPNREVRLPKGFKVIFENNPNKCSVFIPKFNVEKKNVLIVADPSLKVLPRYFLVFIYFHELGHFLYKTRGKRDDKTESKCDDFAFNTMLDRGYNISQIVTACKFSLKNLHRKKKNYQRAKKTKIK